MWNWLVRLWRSVTDWKLRRSAEPVHYHRSNLHGRR